MNFGILYTATGARCREEAIRSATTAKSWMPEVPIAIHTDRPELLPESVFSVRQRIENPHFHFIDKILPLTQSPFERTLFLDTDTMVVGTFYELEELLDRFELAYCHAPSRVSTDFHVESCPLSFPEPNTGVILFRNINQVRNVFQRWHELYVRQLDSEPRPNTDQPAFRKVVYDSNLNFAILPPEYNLRTVFPLFIGRNLRAKILHGDAKTMRRVKRMNEKKDGYVVGNWNYDKGLKPFKRKVRQFGSNVIKPLVPITTWKLMKRLFGSDRSCL